MLASLGYLKVSLAMLIWGSVGIFVRWADQPAHIIVFTRVTVAFFALLLYIRMQGISINLHGKWKPALLSGAALALNWLFFFKSIQTTTIGNAVLTYYMAPIFSIIWARLFLQEQLEKLAVYSLILSTFGISLMLSGYEFSLTSHDFVGILYGLIGALFYSSLSVSAKTMPQVSGPVLALVQMAVSALIFLPSVMAAPPSMSLQALGVMSMLGLLHTAFALGIYLSGLKEIKIQHASILSYLDPVSALLYAYLAYAEIPGPYTAIGGLSILAASCLVIGRRT